TQSTAHWLERLRAARIPCGPVNNVAQALGDAQVQAREMVVDVRLKTGETLRMPGNPVKLAGASRQLYSCPPALGEHTREVLSDLLGYNQEKLAQLYASGSIA